MLKKMDTVFIILASIFGLLTAMYIYWKRKRGPMVCLIGESCDDVLRSKYATIFFGIPNELIGAVYFGGVTIAFSIFTFYPALFTPFLLLLSILGTGLGALYALYLVGIQAFVLKKWCEKCLTLSFFTFAVFLLVARLFF